MGLLSAPANDAQMLSQNHFANPNRHVWTFNVQGHILSMECLPDDSVLVMDFYTQSLMANTTSSGPVYVISNRY
jgi:hypothetical protein